MTTGYGNKNTADNTEGRSWIKKRLYDLLIVLLVIGVIVQIAFTLVYILGLEHLFT